MSKILLILLLCAGIALGVGDEMDEQSKLIYIKQDSNLSTQSYVGQIVAVKYNIIALEDASIRSIAFLDAPNVSIKNPNSSWSELPDGSLENTIYFKILSPKAFIPPLEVIAQKGDFVETERSDALYMNAIALGDNHKHYIGVVAQKLEIGHFSVKFYDKNHNIIVFDISAEYGNLEDLRIKSAREQGFESKSFGITHSNGIYYAVVPNNILDIELEYFELPTQSYKMLHIKNVINKEQISVNQEISPINNVLIFQNIIIFIAIVVLVGLVFMRKIPLKGRIAILCVAIALLIYLIFSLNFKKDGVTIQEAYLTILPTKNSTIIDRIPQHTRVDILSTHADYCKIMTLDGKIGWVAKDTIK